MTDFSEEWTQESDADDPAIAEPPEGGYIGNVNSEIFHTLDCSSLPAEHNRICFDSREEAIEVGQRPCQRCNP